MRQRVDNVEIFQFQEFSSGKIGQRKVWWFYTRKQFEKVELITNVTKMKEVAMKRRNYSKRKIILALVVAFTLVIVSYIPSCFAADNTIRIGLSTRFYGPVLPVYVAESLKLYEKYGIKAEITAYKGGAAAMEALAAGAADLINYFPPGIALAHSQGVKSKIVAAGSIKPQGWWVMVKKNSPIKSPKDLSCKKIGVTSAGSTTHFLAAWAANYGGVKAEYIPVGGGGLVPNLIQGSLDAVVAFPALSYSLQVNGEGRILIDLGKEMPENLPDVWVASQKIIDNNPELLKKALKATYASVKHLKENPQYAVKYIKDFNNYEQAVAELEYKNTIMGLSDNGMIKREWLDASLSLAKLVGSGSQPPIELIYTDKFLPIKLD